MSDFRKTFLEAVRRSNIPAFQKSRLRLRSLSPVFQREVGCVICEHVLEATPSSLELVGIGSAIIQQCSEYLTNDDNTAYVDWDRLLEFIEKLLPIILKLIDLFT